MDTLGHFGVTSLTRLCVAFPTLPPSNTMQYPHTSVSVQKNNTSSNRVKQFQSKHTKKQLGTRRCNMSDKAYGLDNERRRSANYKPNMWSYDFVQSLKSEFIDVVYEKRIEKLKEEVIHLLSEVPKSSELQIVDIMSKLGLSSEFDKYISEALDSIASNINKADVKEDILKTALSFRLLRQHGHNISQDVFIDFIDKTVPLEERVGYSLKGVLEMYEASHLAMESEEILFAAKSLSYKNLVDNKEYLEDDNVAQQVVHALEGPYHSRVPWFDVRHQIHAYEQEDDYNKILLDFAKFKFNITQAMHLEELKKMSRWWKNLGLIENIDFSRDRIVESFLWTVGVAFEPQYAILRKHLTKVAIILLVIDDLYDIYGSLLELNIFTKAVERWDDNSEEMMQQLPESMKICFNTIRDTTGEIANEIRKENGWDDDISFYLNTAWADFCKALLLEAQWYNANHIPSLEEYLRCASITSSAPLACLVTLMCTNNGELHTLNDKLREARDLVYYISLIIRLCNDLGTSVVELERGDSPSSILCYMVEANVTEETAREHIKKMVANTLKKINGELLRASPGQKTFVNLIMNMARVCQFVYREGDCFTVPNKETHKQIKGLLLEPIQLSLD